MTRPLSFYQTLPRIQKGFSSTFCCNIASVASSCIGACRVLLSRQDTLHMKIFCRDKLRGNLLLKHYQLEVDLRHVGLYNDELAHDIQDRPADNLPLVSGFLHVATQLLFSFVSSKAQLPKPHAPFYSLSFPTKNSKMRKTEKGRIHRPMSSQRYKSPSNLVSICFPSGISQPTP